MSDRNDQWEDWCYDEQDDREPEMIECDKCGRATAHETCGGCGMDLCPMCFECGGGFCGHCFG